MKARDGGAAPTIQRVAAAEVSSSGAVRSSRPSVLPAAAASDSRRVATGVDARAPRISPITTPTARQRSASSIAHSTSRGARGRDRDQPFGRQAGGVETGAIGHAVLGEREILGDPDDAVSPEDRGPRTPTAAAARLSRGDRLDESPAPPRRQPERKAGGGGGVRLARGGDLVQCAAAEPAAERGVDGRNAECKRRRRTVQPERGFGGAQLLAQPVEERPIRRAA